MGRTEELEAREADLETISIFVWHPHQSIGFLYMSPNQICRTLLFGSLYDCSHIFSCLNHIEKNQILNNNELLGLKS